MDQMIPVFLLKIEQNNLALFSNRALERNDLGKDHFQNEHVFIGYNKKTPPTGTSDLIMQNSI